MKKLIIMGAIVALSSPALATNPGNNGGGNGGCGVGQTTNGCGGTPGTPGAGGNGGAGGAGGAGGQGGKGGSAIQGQQQGQGQVQGQGQQQRSSNTNNNSAVGNGGSATGGSSNQSQGQQSSNNNSGAGSNSNNNNYSFPANSAYAPSFALASPCQEAISGGLQGFLFGASFGRAYTLEFCKTVMKADYFRKQGREDMAKAMECNDSELRAAHKGMGTPCRQDFTKEQLAAERAPAPVMASSIPPNCTVVQPGNYITCK